MSQEELDVVTGVFRDTNARDFSAAMDAYGDDVTLKLHSNYAGPSGQQVVRGKEAVGEWFGDWFRQFGDDYRFDIEDQRVAENRVFLVAAHHGHGRASGVPVEQRAAYVYTVDEGKIRRIEVWPEAEKLLAVERFQAG